MLKKLTLGSLFDGSAGFPLGGVISGITPVWASEIEPFPIRVTTKRLPFMKHYGDVSVLNGAELPPVDIITFGSPCQDMSIAGKRSGLDGSRSSLFYEATRIVKEMRFKTNGKYPRFIVWENVPGAFSSNKGEDFRCVLEEICKVKDPEFSVPASDKWANAGEIVGEGFSVAWRLFDAQFWGVPQRRKRIYLVADFADGCAGKILFESEGLSGYTPQGFRAWESSTSDSREGTQDTSIGLMFENHRQDTRYTGSVEVAPTIVSAYGTGGNNQPFVLQTPKTLKIRSRCEGGGKGALIQDDLSATLGTHNDQTVFVPRAFGICSKDSNSMRSDNPNSGFYEAETSRCLDANGGNPSCNQGGIAVVAVQGSMIGRAEKNGPQGSGIGEDVSFTLNTTDRHAVCAPEDVYAMTTGSYMQVEKEVAPTLMARDYKDPTTIVSASPTVNYIVRRLTPTECARLQGFPDWWCNDLGTENPAEEDLEFWTDVFETHRKIVTHAKKSKTKKQIVKWLKNPHSDSAEYKMWGNGVALPNVVFVLSGIVYYA